MTRSPKQAQLLTRLVRSSAFTQAERERTRQWVESEGCTIQACAHAIDRAMHRIETNAKQERPIDQRIDALTDKIIHALEGATQ